MGREVQRDSLKLMGPVEAAQTPPQKTQRQVPSEISCRQFRLSTVPCGQPAGYSGWVAESAHLRPQIGTEPAVLISYITSEPTGSWSLHPQKHLSRQRLS